MAFEKGDLSDLFFSVGIKFGANKMYKFANNFNYDEQSSETVEPQAEAEVQESTNDKIVRESDKRPKAAQDHPKKARTLPKTGCYAAICRSPPHLAAQKPTGKTNHPITLYPRKVSKPGFSGFLNQNDDDDESEEKASTNENPDIKFKISN